MTMRKPRASYLSAALICAGLAPAPAHAESDTLGPIAVNVANCGDKVTVNLMIFVCANPSKCDYALGVNNYSGAPVSYTLAVTAPPNYPIYAQGLRTSKNYDAYKVISAPQAAGGPPVKIAMSCVRANSPPPPTLPK
jgi:hypothetical protein